MYSDRVGTLGRGRRRGPEARVLVDLLTERERELLVLIADGWSNPAIGVELHLTAKTVESHVRNIYGKLGLPAGDGTHRRVRAALIYIEACAERPVLERVA